MQIDKFSCDKEKLNHIVKEICKKTNILKKDIAKDLKMGASKLTKLLSSTDGSNLKLENIHIYAILSVCNLPKEVFFECHTKQEINNIIEQTVSKKNNNLSHPNIPKELKKLIGTSYLYAYNNNLKTHASLFDSLPPEKQMKINFITEVEVSIDNYCVVRDQNNNMGKLIMLTENLSLIFIEDRNNKETIVYTFENKHVHLNQFLFSKRSKQDYSNEMLAFGFLSKEKLNDEIVEFFLDKDYTKTQLQVSTKFLEQISSYNQIEEC